MLDYDPRERAYRLAAPLLSLGQAMRTASPILQVAAPLMRRTAEELKINVGLATMDREEMVYLESVRYNRKVSLRNVVAGLRVPIELTSLGRAYLAAATPDERKTIIAHLMARRPDAWAKLHEEIEQALRSVELHGYCAASWQPEVVALATPLVCPGYAIHVLNVSVATAEPLSSVVEKLHRPLIALATTIQDGMGSRAL